MTGTPTKPIFTALCSDETRFLRPAVVRYIDRALAKVGDFGEVRLIVVKGRLRFVQIVQSENLHEKLGDD